MYTHHTKDVTAIILAGGEGSRLKPLTNTKCKPAIEFAGQHKIIDVTLSNALNSKLSEIYILTQFLAPSLNNYITNSYPNQPITLKTPKNFHDKNQCYLGTADAVRKNLSIINDSKAKYFLILSGDQIYTMDFSSMAQFGKINDADLVIASLPVNDAEAMRMGVMRINEKYKIKDFYEKPTEQSIRDKFCLSTNLPEEDRVLLGSMGIYLFKKEALLDLLKKDPREDFGKHIIPTALQTKKCFSFVFDGYWSDIGTIKSYFNTSILMTNYQHSLNLFDKKLNRLAPTKFYDTAIDHSIITDGSIIQAKKISHSLIGNNHHILKGTMINHSILIGNDRKNVSIGKNCTIDHAIIDSNCTIGNNVTLTNKNNIQHLTTNNLLIRDGIIIVPSGTTLVDNFYL